MFLKLPRKGETSGGLFLFYGAKMQELSLFENQEKWYTIEELADLCGLQAGSCKNILTRIWKSFQNDYQNIRVQNIGGHKNIKLYSENVLKAIKDYQLKNNASNALQNKEAAIKVVEKNGIQSVSARELYEKLEITHRFNEWFSAILKYGFEENIDFTSVQSCTVVNNGAKKPIIDYVITIEMAKQICMLQRSDKGRKYREYFLQLERAWNTPEAVMARALQVANLTLENAKKQIAILQPKAEVYDDFLSRDKFCNFRDGANYLGISQSEFMDLLKSKYIYKNNIGEYRAYAEYTDYFTLRPFARGTERTGQQLMLNLQGLEYFKTRIKKGA